MGKIRAPVAVLNYRSPEGWAQAYVTDEEEGAIRALVREKDCQIIAECFQDAREALKNGGQFEMVAPGRLVTVALALYGSRRVHISKVFDEYLQLKAEGERQAQVEGRRPKPKAEMSHEIMQEWGD